MRRFLKLLNRENGAAGGSGNNMGSNQSQSRKGVSFMKEIKFELKSQSSQSSSKESSVSSSSSSSSPSPSSSSFRAAGTKLNSKKPFMYGEKSFGMRSLEQNRKPNPLERNSVKFGVDSNQSSSGIVTVMRLNRNVKTKPGSEPLNAPGNSMDKFSFGTDAWPKTASANGFVGASPGSKNSANKGVSPSSLESGIWNSVNLSSQKEKQNLVKQSLRVEYLALGEKSSSRSKPRAVETSNACPPGDRSELQMFFEFLSNSTPLLEEMLEKPILAQDKLVDCPLENLKRIESFDPPAAEFQIERSLADEFNSPIQVTDWSSFEESNPSLLQAAVLHQSYKTQGTPMTLAEVISDSETCLTLSHEIESGDYTRYSSPAYLLGELQQKLEKGKVSPFTMGKMVQTAYQLGLNRHLNPEYKKKIISQVYALLERADTAPADKNLTYA